MNIFEWLLRVGYRKPKEKVVLVVVKEAVELFDTTTEKNVVLEPGTYNFVEVPNPYRHKYPWLMKSGTTMGGSIPWWEFQVYQGKVTLTYP